MRRSIPLAYVTASYSNCTSGAQIAKAAQKYCTRIKEAGYIPICPDFQTKWKNQLISFTKFDIIFMV